MGFVISQQRVLRTNTFLLLFVLTTDAAADCRAVGGAQALGHLGSERILVMAGAF